ncbi:hypothetical protein MVEN_02236900 [Mycena venus]|uniref:RNase III domain-containing protein n=1 Tax=Mycena venus TaxID=2733690 RepID=A0A8H6X895_9AGAR|nr:hypothetical protein MVEN_02236900 [Mycena venus]
MSNSSIPLSDQDHLRKIIQSAAFAPGAPPCDGLYSFLFSSPDPELLHCLETLGDSRLAAILTRLQIKQFNDIPLYAHKQSKSALISNATFQLIVQKLGMDKGGTPNKHVGNAFEIFVEALGKICGNQGAAEWVREVLTPLIEGLVGHLRGSSSVKRRRLNPPQKTQPRKTTVDQKLKVDKRREARLARRGHKSNIVLRFQVCTTYSSSRCCELIQISATYFGIYFYPRI